MRIARKRTAGIQARLMREPRREKKKETRSPIIPIPFFLLSESNLMFLPNTNIQIYTRRSPLNTQKIVRIFAVVSRFRSHSTNWLNETKKSLYGLNLCFCRPDGLFEGCLGQTGSFLVAYSLSSSLLFSPVLSSLSRPSKRMAVQDSYPRSRKTGKGLM